jgi:hypothetical protein
MLTKNRKMNEEINRAIEQIEEKFTRCPECRSFSVKQTRELTLKEKIKAVFVTVKVHQCDNCSYRFVEFGSFSTGLKHLFRSLTATPSRRFMALALPIAAAVVLVAIPFLAGSKEKEPVIPGEKKPVQAIEKDLGPKIKKSLPPVIPAEPSPITPSIAGEIVLGNSNRFGVNWRLLGQGVQITRLSNGSLKKAGLRVGDILVEVEGQKVMGGGANLETARDDVFHGTRSEVLVKVQRGEEALFFKILKRKR